MRICWPHARCRLQWINEKGRNCPVISFLGGLCFWSASPLRLPVLTLSGCQWDPPRGLLFVVGDPYRPSLMFMSWYLDATQTTQIWKAFMMKTSSGKWSFHPNGCLLAPTISSPSASGKAVPALRASLEDGQWRSMAAGCLDHQIYLGDTLQGTKIPHLGERKIIFKSALWWEWMGYVSSQEGPPFLQSRGESSHLPFGLVSVLEPCSHGI